MSIILRLPTPPADAKPVYPLDDPALIDELNFFKLKTGIQDEQKLKSHICEIQEKAWKLYPFPCVFNFDFVRGKVINHPMYQHAVEAAKKQSIPQKIFLDFGSCLGSQLRQVILNGWKREDVLGIDVMPEWVNIGYELFKDAAEPIPFFIGDIFQREVFDPFKQPPEDLPETLDLFSLKDLNNLKGRASIISASFLFHLFGEKDQDRLAGYFALLLSNQPGSSIIGMQRGSESKGLNTLVTSEAHLYSHSAASWAAMWEKCFEPNSVKIVAELQESKPETQFEYIHGGKKVLWLYWSVTRL